jgi:hypothetical protein
MRHKLLLITIAWFCTMRICSAEETDPREIFKKVTAA